MGDFISDYKVRAIVTIPVAKGWLLNIGLFVFVYE